MTLEEPGEVAVEVDDVVEAKVLVSDVVVEVVGEETVEDEVVEPIVRLEVCVVTGGEVVVVKGVVLVASDTEEIDVVLLKDVVGAAVLEEGCVDVDVADVEEVAEVVG